ncbi:hypothetical protein CDLVIII_0069 [Clostridium sp. DL-VIII]|uniref:hypothetical protein n=1 Tax=Clostridium sp. DL-VIII TaxID=641107 RepID=UPI00023AF6EA|nr:hypothetical protein [Clostridium sp. DL-VIII]EHI96811.1 hypothetical protein CDLVIII_0069 [Clostridium sp. DL-VIII]
MRKQVKRLIIFILLLTFSIGNPAYAQVKSAPFGPKVTDLKDKEGILNNFQQIKTIRSNLTVIDISPDLTTEQLQATNTNIQNYIQQMQGVRENLQRNANTYRDSFADVFFSEQIMLIADSYIISLRNQQLVIRSIEANVQEAKKLFYSSYMIPVYYYLTLGDQMAAYIDVYFVV